jgi:hypothetical protein
MKWSLRNFLLAVPLFGTAIGIYLHKLSCIEAIRKAREIGTPLPESQRWLNEGPAVFIAVIGVAILFGYWRVAAAIGIPTLLAIALFYLRII